jgi:hypothetical protein
MEVYKNQTNMDQVSACKAVCLAMQEVLNMRQA